MFATARNLADVDKLKLLGLSALQLDVADTQSIDRALQGAFDATGGYLDALFNNAGFGVPGAVEDLTREALQAQFDTNLFGAVELIHKVIPAMRKQGHGRIVQNSSVLGFIVLPFRGAYSASKFALEALTDTLRLELNGTKIHISLIEPGPITSRFRQNAYRAFQTHIHLEKSVFKTRYGRMKSRLTHKGNVAPFTLPASAVVNKLIHALESPRPKARYYVTLPTYIFAYLKRVLPVSLLDKVLLKISRNETS